MCGRYTLNSSPARLKEHFATINELNLKPRFEITPTQTAPIVHLDETGSRVFTFARWGLILSGVNEREEASFNTRAETAAIKPMFRHAYRKSRVLVPADEFFKWAPRNVKQPYLIRLRDGEPMGIGCLLVHWQADDGDVAIFTILTVDANSLIARICDRMPVIIRPKDYDNWIDSNFTDVIRIQAMVQPYPDRLMETYPVIRKTDRQDSHGLIGNALI